MLKRFIPILLIALFMASCGKQTIYDVNSFLTAADTLTEQEIVIKGTVTHVCVHSGKKCFIKAEGSEETIKIETGGEIESFSQDLIGKEVIVLGIVKESRTEQADIESKEAAINETKLEALEATDEETVEHCDAAQKSLDNMKKWMKDHGKDYYAVYYIEGIKQLK